MTSTAQTRFRGFSKPHKGFQTEPYPAAQESAPILWRRRARTSIPRGFGCRWPRVRCDRSRAFCVGGGHDARRCRMPIITVEAIGSPSEFPAEMAQQIADSVGSALETGPRDTWVKVHFIPPAQYAENGTAVFFGTPTHRVHRQIREYRRPRVGSPGYPAHRPLRRSHRPPSRERASNL